MKKKLFFIVIFGLFLAACTDDIPGVIGAEPLPPIGSELSSSSRPSSASAPTLPPYERPVVEWPVPGDEGTGAGNPVAYYGALKKCVIERRGFICGENTGDGKPVQLKGVSLGWSNPRINAHPRWINWTSSEFFKAPDKTVDGMYDKWKAEVIRAPLGVDPARCQDGNNASDTQNGYPENPTENKEEVEAIVDAAIAKGMFVIIDFHTHRGTKYKQEAIDFFTDMAVKYGSVPNIIWEIWNEPCTWHTADEVKTYANEIIPIIRAHSENLILVGSPYYSQQPNAIKGITDANVAYTFHFYAATHTVGGLSKSVTQAMDAGLPVFVSEFGTVDSGGGGNHNQASANMWLDYLDNRYISYVAWQLNNFDQSSSYFPGSFNPATADPADWGNKAKMNGESGKYIFDKLNEAASEQPWRAVN